MAYLHEFRKLSYVKIRPQNLITGFCEFPSLISAPLTLSKKPSPLEYAYKNSAYTVALQTSVATVPSSSTKS
ncbi:hypothetical protein FHG87_011234 [Trinorchestia longiramus]|nr:hypothetical protein FHG87_011234 [Trinorchestia longiramus]